MKIQMKLILSIGGTAILSLIAFLILAMIVFENNITALNAKIVREEMKRLDWTASAETDAEKNKLMNYFSRTFRILNEPGKEKSISGKEIKGIILVANAQGKNPEIIFRDGESRQQKSSHAGIVILLDFLRNCTFVQTKSAVILPEKAPNFLLAVQSFDYGKKAKAVIIDIPELVKLSQTESVSPSRTVLFCGKNASAPCDTGFGKFTHADAEPLLKLSLQESLSPNSRKVRRISVTDESRQLYIYSIATLDVPTVSPLGFRIGKIFPRTEQSKPLLDQKTRNKTLITLALLMLCSVIFFFCVLIIVSRNLAITVRRLTRFVDAVTKGRNTPELELGFSREFSETAANVNLLRDKLNSISIRLFRSHDREKTIRQETDNTHRFQLNILENVMEEQEHPLNAALGYAEMIMRSAPGITPAIAAREIHRSLLHVSDFRKVLADWGHCETSEDKNMPEETLVSVPELIHETASSFFHKSQEKQISIETRSSSGVPMEIWMNRDSLLHLLRTAVLLQMQTSPEKGRICLGCSSRENKLEFWCKCKVPKGFRPFAEILEQLSAPRQSQLKQGESVTLLLLLILQKEAQHLSAETEFSIEENSVNRITIRLPFKSAGDMRSERIKATDIYGDTNQMVSVSEPELKRRKIRLHAADRLRILIVDRSEDERKMIRTMLADCSAEIEEAADERECYEKLGCHSFDVVLLDAGGLPHREYANLAVKLRKIQTGQMILIGTSSQNVSGKIGTFGLSAAFDAIIEKPFFMDSVIGTIHSFIQKEV